MRENSIQPPMIQRVGLHKHRQACPVFAATGLDRERGLSIHIFAMANPHDLNGDNVLLDFVDDPVVIHTWFHGKWLARHVARRPWLSLLSLLAIHRIREWEE